MSPPERAHLLYFTLNGKEKGGKEGDKIKAPYFSMITFNWLVSPNVLGPVGYTQQFELQTTVSWNVKGIIDPISSQFIKIIVNR